MVTTNFTITGNRVKVLAYLDCGKPTFDLIVCGEPIKCGANIRQLREFSEEIIKELDEIRRPYLNAGSKIQDFAEMWNMKEEADGDD